MLPFAETGFLFLLCLALFQYDVLGIVWLRQGIWYRRVRRMNLGLILVSSISLWNSRNLLGFGQIVCNWKTMSGLASTIHSMNLYRQQNHLCDFLIKAGTLRFPAHRIVLSAVSDYFRGMFSSDSTENKDGNCEIKGINPYAIGISVDYIYTKKAEITLETVTDILKAAHLLQLDGLMESCFQYLKDTLSVSTCILSKTLAQNYCCKELEVTVDEFIIENFAECAKETDFNTLTKADVKAYVSSPKAIMSPKTKMWNVVQDWVKYDLDSRLPFFNILLQALPLDMYPLEFLKEEIWSEPLVKDSKSCRNIVSMAIFDQVRCFKRVGITISTCFFVRSLGRAYGQSDVEKEGTDFMLEHFDDIIDEEEFCQLTDEDMEFFMSSPDCVHSSETVMWTAILRWANHDQKNRSEAFVNLLHSIKLGIFPSKFLQHVIWKEKIVQANCKCQDIVANAILQRTIECMHSMTDNVDTDSCIFIKSLAQQYDNGEAESIVNKYISEHFDSVSEHETFTSLSANDLISLLEHPNLITSSETHAWTATKRWIKYDEAKRLCHFPRLLKSMKLHLMPTEFLKSSVINHSYIKDSNLCKEILMDGLLHRLEWFEEMQLKSSCRFQ